MLRSLLPLLGLALLAQTAVAQTTPKTTKKPARTAAKATPRMVPNTSAAAQAANPLRGTNDGGKGQSGYAAPGEPIQDPRYNGKNTPPYDGPAAPTKRNTTINTPK